MKIINYNNKNEKIYETRINKCVFIKKKFSLLFLLIRFI